MSDYPPPPPPPPPPPTSGPQQPGYGSAPSGPQLATWIQRVGAYLIDYALIIVFVILANVFMPKTVTTNINGVVNVSQSSGNLGLAFLMSLIILAIWGYNRWYNGGRGQSFGKKTLNLVLVAEATGQPIGTAKAFLRDVAHVLDGICMIGYLFPLWDAKRQTFADKIMTTVVPLKV
ncbi:MAG TPA: RDD family protein [Dermatophilaceae bacterium]